MATAAAATATPIGIIVVVVVNRLIFNSRHHRLVAVAHSRASNCIVRRRDATRIVERSRVGARAESDARRALRARRSDVCQCLLIRLAPADTRARAHAPIARVHMRASERSARKRAPAHRQL